MTKARRAKAKSTRNACPWTIFLMENENISAKGLLHTKITKSARERYATGLPPVLLHPTESWLRVIKTDCPQGTIRHLKGKSLG